ncbi:MAG TPA: hypothetical protein VKV39_09360 [Candidatus Sulfotelmatobacter sp.]|nr:hypothetical protein [Candidatus Sulfotelmatobacter sp.]
MIRQFALLALLACVSAAGLAQESEDRDKNLDVRSPMGDLHVGKDADARKAGLPLYPGARPEQNEHNDPLNFGLATESFGLKLVVAKYESDDSPDKVLAFYRGKLKRYGKVLECHSANDNAEINHDDKDHGSQPLKCDGDDSGPVRQLKVGTENDAHIVSVEPAQTGNGTTFTLVYLHKREKEADI